MTTTSITGIIGPGAIVGALGVPPVLGQTLTDMAIAFESRPCEPRDPMTIYAFAYDAQDADPTAEARRFSATLPPTLREQADRAIAWLSTEARHLGLTHLPPLLGRISDDGSVALEMRFPDRRLAFTLEVDAEESGWHMVSRISAGGFIAHGPLSGKLSLPLAWFADARR